MYRPRSGREIISLLLRNYPFAESGNGISVPLFSREKIREEKGGGDENWKAFSSTPSCSRSFCARANLPPPEAPATPLTPFSLVYTLGPGRRRRRSIHRYPPPPPVANYFAAHTLPQKSQPFWQRRRTSSMEELQQGCLAGMGREGVERMRKYPPPIEAMIRKNGKFVSRKCLNSRKRGEKYRTMGPLTYTTFNVAKRGFHLYSSLCISFTWSGHSRTQTSNKKTTRNLPGKENQTDYYSLFFWLLRIF